MNAATATDQQVKTLTFSSIKFKHPSLGTKAAIFLPFLISCTRAHFLMAELGCLASIPLQPTQVVSDLLSKYHRERLVQSLTLTSSLERSPWRGKLLRRVSSTHYPSDSSCSPYLPIVAAFCGCEAYVQLPNLWSYCNKSNKHLMGHLNRLGNYTTLCTSSQSCQRTVSHESYPMFAT